MKIFLLYNPHATTARQAVFLGGGSSTPAMPRIYFSADRAASMRHRHFPNAHIKEISLP